MSAAHELPALVTVDDAAASLALHPDHVRRLVRTGELVGYRLGRAVRVEADSVRAYLARCRLHVPRVVPPLESSSAAPTSTDAGPRGTPAEAPRSRRRGSASTPPTAPKPSDASETSWSEGTPQEIAARLRALGRRISRGSSPAG
jgi:excisionase family DNA binding protein